MSRLGERKLARLTLDTPFKKAFGTEASKATLKHFLSAVYDDTSHPAIESIENVEVKSNQRCVPPFYLREFAFNLPEQLLLIQPLSDF